ncbi:MAG: diversity-generating retroelement protein Avd [Clostridia bacterium]|nr:diversity-generating retroelement protein Avd [Clostridia bacterium]
MAKKDDRLIVYEKITKLIIYSKNLLNKYPKSERFDLCTDIKNTLYQSLEQVMYALKTKDTRERIRFLTNADVKLYVLKTLTRLSYEFQYITPKNYMTWDNLITEIGKMIGGWIRACQKE